MSPSPSSTRRTAQAVAFVAIDLRWLADLARQVNLPPEYSLVIVDREGCVLAHAGPASEVLIEQGTSVEGLVGLAERGSAAVLSIAGVVLYCTACFAAGSSAEFGAMLTENSVPFARSTLGVIGLGTLLWLTGSLTFLKGAIDSTDDASLL